MSGEIHGSQPNPLLLNLNNIDLSAPTAEPTRYTFHRVGGDKRTRETDRDTTSAADHHNDAAINLGLGELKGNAMASVTVRDLNRLRQNLLNRATPGDPAMPIIPQNWVPKCMEQARALGIPVQIDANGHLSIGGESIDDSTDGIPESFMEALIADLEQGETDAFIQTDENQTANRNVGNSNSRDSSLIQQGQQEPNTPISNNQNVPQQAQNAPIQNAPQQTPVNPSTNVQGSQLHSTPPLSNDQTTTQRPVNTPSTDIQNAQIRPQPSTQNSSIIQQGLNEANSVDTTRGVQQTTSSVNHFLDASVLTKLFMLLSEMANEMTVNQSFMGGVVLDSMANIMQSAQDNAELTLQAGQKEKEDFEQQAKLAMINMYAAVTTLVLSVVATAVSIGATLKEPTMPDPIENPDEIASMQGNIKNTKPEDFNDFKTNRQPFASASRKDASELMKEHNEKIDAEVNLGQEPTPKMTRPEANALAQKNATFNRINDQRTADLQQWKSDVHKQDILKNSYQMINSVTSSVGEIIKNAGETLVATQRGNIALEKSEIEAKKIVIQALGQIYNKQLDVATNAMQTDADMFSKTMESLTNMITSTRQGIEATNR